MKTCPFCAEEIQDAAKVCKHCGRDVVTGGSTTQRVVVEQPKSRRGMGCLLALLLPILFIGWCMNSVMSPSTTTQAPVNSAAPAANATPAAAGTVGRLAPEGKGKAGRHSYSWITKDGIAMFTIEPPIRIDTNAENVYALEVIKHIFETEFKINMKNVAEPRPVDKFLRFNTADDSFDVLLIKNERQRIIGLGFRRV